MSCGSTTPSHSPLLRPADPLPLPLPQPLPSLLGWFAGLLRLQVRWRRRAELREMEDWLLRDIGLTREQIEHEAQRPLWR